MSGSIFDPMTDPGWGMAPPVNPYQSGFASGSGFVDDPGTTFDNTGGGVLGSGISGTDLAGALKQLSSATKPQSASGTPASQQKATAGTATSGTGQGSPAGINALINMLMQRSNQYFPGQPNRQPVALARPSGGGLLGI